MDLIYTGKRKRRDLPRNVGVWGSWERVKAERRGRKGTGEKCLVKQKTIKNK